MGIVPVIPVLTVGETVERIFEPKQNRKKKRTTEETDQLAAKQEEVEISKHEQGQEGR